MHNGETQTLPMFPLGLVALPGSVIPLRLFEQRYLQMHRDLLAGTGEFGIVLIERGVAEAKGGDYFPVGTVMRLVGEEALDDGSILVVAVATDRVRVVEWLEDDPYPRARVGRLPAVGLSPVDASAVERCISLWMRLRALASELGADVGAEAPDIDAGRMESVYAMARLSGLQDLDLQRILEAENAGVAVEVLENELEAIILELENRLSEG